MLACKIFSLLVASAGIVFLLIALVTDYWLVAYGPRYINHSGLWQECLDGKCITEDAPDGYILATRAFLILAALVASITVICLLASFTPSIHVLRGAFIASIAAFVAGLCTFIAIAVFTAESWNKDVGPQIQCTYQWSFYLGCTAFPMLLLAGIFSLVAHLCSPTASYESI
ncbi:protein NKG7-like [Hemicordylus capensis]|uniref:protein NKG7-like n=1 Tax=Hemicordylus capensis TaxID=884348 RepID=UPI002304C162|nr:protein NKG7-like [Hemicordylus capensis]